MSEEDRIFWALFLLNGAFTTCYFAGMALAMLKGKSRIVTTTSLYAATIGLSVAAFVIRDESPTNFYQYMLYVLGTGSLAAWCIKLIAYRDEAWVTFRQMISQFGYFAVGIPALMLAATI